MPKFRAILNPRVIGEYTIAPEKHSPTAFKSLVIEHRKEYEAFDIGSEKVEATLEKCLEVKAAISKKYGQDLVNFEPVVSAAEAAEFEAFRRHKAAQESAANKPKPK